MLDVVLSLMTAVHLLSVNIAAAAPLVSIWLEWKEFRGDLLAGRAGRALLLMAIIGTFVGALLGLLIGWLLWDEGLSAAVNRLPSKISFGVMEIFFSLVLTIIQVAWWRAAPQGPAWHRVGRTLLALLAGTNLVYHFPVLFGVVTELIHRGDLSSDVIDASEFRQELVGGSVLPRAIHFLLAAIATCGVALMLYGCGKLMPATDDQRHRVVMWGGRLAIVATLAQIPAGLWLMTRLTPTAQHRLMGNDMWGTTMFGLALLATLWLAHVLATVALGDTSRRHVYRGAVLFMIVVWLMSGASRRAFAPTNTGPVDRLPRMGSLVTSDRNGAFFRNQVDECS